MMTNRWLLTSAGRSGSNNGSPPLGFGDVFFGTTLDLIGDGMTPLAGITHTCQQRAGAAQTLRGLLRFSHKTPPTVFNVEPEDIDICFCQGVSYGVMLDGSWSMRQFAAPSPRHNLP